MYLSSDTFVVTWQAIFAMHHSMYSLFIKRQVSFSQFYLSSDTFVVTWRAISVSTTRYGVATISRLLKIIGLFCKRALRKSLYSAKETCNFKEPTNRSHPISSFHTLVFLYKIVGLFYTFHLFWIIFPTCGQFSVCTTHYHLFTYASLFKQNHRSLFDILRLF